MGVRAGDRRGQRRDVDLDGAEDLPRPGLATGLFMNTRRIGAILSGPIIAVAGIESLGYPGVFALCAALTGVALAVFLLARRAGRATR